MPSKSSGKVIAKIKVNKKNVVITFVDHSKLTCESEVLANYYLYEGKTLEYKTIKDIEQFNASIALMKYAMSLIKKGHLSEWKMREKLYAKEGKKSDVDRVIKTLKINDLINDKMLMLDTIEYGNERNLGKNKIMQDLADKGIFQEKINSASFPYSLEKRKALNNLPKLEKRYERYPYEQKKQHVYHALLSLGFDHDVALEALNHLKSANQKEENNKLKNDFPKVYRKYQNKYEGYELKNKVITSLKGEGYKMKDILSEWEKRYGENDF